MLYSDVDLGDGGSAVVICILKMWYILCLLFFSFLLAPQHGPKGVACLDLEMGSNGCGLLVLLISCARCQVHVICILEIIFVRSFDPVASSVDYR